MLTFYILFHVSIHLVCCVRPSSLEDESGGSHLSHSGSNVIATGPNPYADGQGNASASSGKPSQPAVDPGAFGKPQGQFNASEVPVVPEIAVGSLNTSGKSLGDANATPHASKNSKDGLKTKAFVRWANIRNETFNRWKCPRCALADTLRTLLPTLCKKTWNCTKLGICSIPNVTCKDGMPSKLELRNYQANNRRLPESLFRISTLEELELDKMGLVGTIPLSVGWLKRLRVLSLSGNKLQGHLDGLTFRSLTSLQVLRLDQNELVDTIPEAIADLKHLQVLELQGNRLKGRVPPNLFSHPSLRILKLGNNKLSDDLDEVDDLPRVVQHKLEIIDLSHNLIQGRLPSQLFNSTQLREVHLQYNDFGGPIPSELRDSQISFLQLSHNRLVGDLRTIPWTNTLTDLFLQVNHFDGQIPVSIAQLKLLTNIDVSHNRISGTIPTEFGSLQHLQILDIAFNNMEGQIPTVLDQCRNLKKIMLRNNSLTGTLPTTFGMMTRLTYFNVNENLITGTLPSEYGSLKRMRLLMMNDNNLVGTIPTSWGDMTDLIGLDLSINYISGTIPSELGKLVHMQALSLSDNYLAGTIPTELAHLKTMSFLMIHENMLGGTMPPLHMAPQENDPQHSVVISAFSNRLSCHVPRLGPPGEKDQGMGGNLYNYLSLGNEFREGDFAVTDGGEPWIDPDDVQLRKSSFAPLITAAFVSWLMWLVTMALTLRSKLGKFIVHDVIMGTWNDTTSLEVEGHCWLMKALFMLSIPCVFGLLPGYWLNANYAECGDSLSRWSIAYYEDRDASIGRFVVPFLWIVHLVIIGHLIRSLMRRAQAKKEELTEPDPVESKWIMFLRSSLTWGLWLLIVAILALPPALYAFFRALPDSNIFHKSVIKYMTQYFFNYISSWFDDGTTGEELGKQYGWWTFVVLLLPAFSTVVTSLIMPGVAVQFSKRSGKELQLLLAVGICLSIWVAPIAVTIWVDEGCFRGSRQYWEFCNDDKIEPFTYTLEGHEFLPRKENWCELPGLEIRGTCLRSVVRVLNPLILVRIVLEVGVLPSLYIISWSLSTKAEDGLLKLFGIVTSFQPYDYFAQLDIWIAIGICWGPLVPLYMPLLMMNVLVSLVNLRLETCYFKREVKQDILGEHVSKGFVSVVTLQLIFFMLLFILETGVCSPRFVQTHLVNWGIVEAHGPHNHE